MEGYFKANTQLMARCTFNKETGKIKFENFSGYYPAKDKRKLFK